VREAARPEVVVALLTPFAPDGSLDIRALETHLDFLLESGVDAVMPAGTTGEGPLLNDSELLALLRSAVAKVDGRTRIVAHVGRPGTAATAELVLRAFELGADAVSAVVPYYYALSDEALLGHYRALLEAASGRDLYAYTIPARTGNELSLDVVRRLGGEGLRGVKDSTKSWDRHLEYLGCGVDVLIGTDSLVVDSFRAGSSGCVSALANVRPDLLCRARDGEDVQDELTHLRERLPFRELKGELARAVAGYPPGYRAPLG
jgi:dihydrodipicolinate synthase/N-acetylneuraminate lyase